MQHMDFNNKCNIKQVLKGKDNYSVAECHCMQLVADRFNNTGNG